VCAQGIKSKLLLFYYSKEETGYTGTIMSEMTIGQMVTYIDPWKSNDNEQMLCVKVSCTNKTIYFRLT
jgi:hypothetical protein